MSTKKRSAASTKLPKRGKNKLPKRKKTKIKFGKRTISALRPPKFKPYYVKGDTETPCLFIRVTPTAKTFFWQKTVRREQKHVNIGRFPEINVEQARAKAADISADYTKGIDVQENKKAKREEMTLGDVWHDYRQNRKRRNGGEDSVALDYQWKSYFKKWKDKQLSEITKAKAQRMILDIRKDAPFHGNRIHAYGRAMFNHAIRELEWNGENPFRFAMVPEKGRERSRRKGARLYDHQIPDFMNGLQACSESMRILFLCSLYTGRRVGEVQAMRWDQLDLKAGLWFLPKTKPGIPQQATLPGQLVDLLKEREKKRKSDEWVFPSPSKSGHVEEIKKAWAIVREASGLHELQARDLRRSFISMAQEAGVPIAAVQAQVGHADIATTARHYTAFSDSEQRRQLDRTVKRMIEAATVKEAEETTEGEALS